jgi:hypothetical protein
LKKAHHFCTASGGQLVRRLHSTLAARTYRASNVNCLEHVGIEYARVERGSRGLGEDKPPTTRCRSMARADFEPDCPNHRIETVFVFGRFGAAVGR